MLVATARLDLYNPVECSDFAAAHIAQCELLRIDSTWGHVVASAADASGVLELNRKIGQFLVRTGMTAPGRQGDAKSPRS